MAQDKVEFGIKTEEERDKKKREIKDGSIKSEARPKEGSCMIFPLSHCITATAASAEERHTVVPVTVREKSSGGAWIGIVPSGLSTYGADNWGKEKRG